MSAYNEYYLNNWITFQIYMQNKLALKQLRSSDAEYRTEQARHGLLSYHALMHCVLLPCRFSTWPTTWRVPWCASSTWSLWCCCCATGMAVFSSLCPCCRTSPPTAGCRSTKWWYANHQHSEQFELADFSQLCFLSFNLWSRVIDTRAAQKKKISFAIFILCSCHTFWYKSSLFSL